MKHKTHEYERRDTKSIEKQVLQVLDSEYQIRSGLNVQKAMYRKRDFYPDVVEEAEEGVEGGEVIA